MNDSRVESTRAYIKENAALGPQHVISLARTEWQRIEALVVGVSEEEAAAHPIRGQWSISEVLQHLTLSHSGNVERIASLADGESFPGPPPVPGALPDAAPATFAEQRREFLNLIERAVVVIEQADPDANQNLTAGHPAFGAYTWLDWAAHMHFHARNHARQIEQIRQALAEQTSSPQNEL